MSKRSPTSEGLAKIPDALEYLQVSRTKLYSLMDDGDLNYVKLGRSRRIPWVAIYDLVERSQNTSESSAKFLDEEV